MPKKRKKSRSSDERVDDQQTVYHELHTIAESNRALRRWMSVDKGTDAYCFARDVMQSVMPYRLDRDVVVTLEPPDDDTEELIATALKHQPYGERFEDAVEEFLRQTAQTMMHFGVADYELIFERQADVHDPDTFFLRYVPPHTIRRRFRWWVQDIGPDAAAERGLPRFLSVDRDKIVRFTPPPQLSSSALYRLKRQLSSLGAHSMPLFNLDFTKRVRTFDFDVAATLRDRALATVTRRIGWRGTASFDKHALDSYAFVRDLTFQRFIVDLRDGMVAQLNSVLAGALRRLGKDGEIRLRKVHSHATLDMLEAEFQAGADLLGLLRKLRDGR